MENSEKLQNKDYRVDLAVFNGPLDLLLYLIKKEEVDIYDIPIAKITKQYLQYIDMMTSLNLEIVGEFILMAATLIRIKTKLLLPVDKDNPEEIDPREELIMALMEYKKYKEAGDILRDKALEEEQKYVPHSPVEKIEGRVDLEPVTTLFDLISAFKDVISNKPDETFHEVEVEDVSIEDRIKYVMEYLQQNEFATFQQLFADVPKKIVAVITFIALLELSRSRRIAIYQSLPYSELRVYRGEMFSASHQEIDLIDITSIKKSGSE
jgi:segregation and condensation protein A